MPDMLVKLYELKNDWSFVEQQERIGVIIRKPIGPEKHLIIDWVLDHFSDAWASETDVALSQHPVTCFIATREDKLIGFACYDATALGIFGPTGVDEAFRGNGTGRALLLACLLDMKLKGYAYAVIGFVGPADFYRKVANAVEIPASSPGLWKGWLVRKKKR